MLHVSCMVFKVDISAISACLWIVGVDDKVTFKLFCCWTRGCGASVCLMQRQNSHCFRCLVWKTKSW